MATNSPCAHYHANYGHYKTPAAILTQLKVIILGIIFRT